MATIDTAVDSADLRAFLARVRALLRRHDAARAFGWTIVALSALALALPLAALALVGPRHTAIAILAGGGMLGALALIGAIVLALIVPARRWKSDAAVARWVGGREPSLSSDLLSAVELEDAPQRKGSPSPALVGALVGVTTSRVRALSPRAMVPRRAARRALLAGAGAIALHAGVVIAAHATIADGWHRLLHAPPAPFGGATQTPTPLVGDLTVTLDAPSYARRPQAVLPSSSGDFRALPGTRVTLATRPLAPVATATVIVEHGDASEDQVPMEVGADGVLRGTFTVMDEVRYRFEVQHLDHKKLVEMTPRRVEIEPDLPPTVQILAPGDDLDVTSMRRIELGVTADDDHGIAKVELVWSDGHDTTRKTLDLLDAPGAQETVQAKVVWDLAEIALPPGAKLDYHIEVTDDDDVKGPNVGSSRELHLHVFSPRERHEQNLDRQEETAEKMLAVLAGRLQLAAAGGDDVGERDELRKVGGDVVVELGTLVAAYDKDDQADHKLKGELEAMRGRIDKLSGAEGRLLDKVRKIQHPGKTMAAADKAVIAELEDDVITLSDWLDRERMESLLDVSDEIAAHKKRLAELMDQYAKTGDPRLKTEIDRELKAIQRGLAELQQKRAGMTADTLDQFVNPDALADQHASGCMDEVQQLFDAGKTAEAQKKLAECGGKLDAAQQALEGALEQLRGDKFAPEQQKLQQLMNDLSDLAQDQNQIAADTDKLFERYADRADQMMRDLGKEAKKRLQSRVAELRQKVNAVPPSGLTPFAQEELDIVGKRLDDLDKMLDDGDIAEALSMARQAKQSLDTVSSELEAALEDDPHGQFAGPTQDAIEAVERAHPPADKLVDELSQLAPSPDQIMDADDKKQLEQLRKRQAAAQGTAKRLIDKASQMGPELPGDAGKEITDRVGEGAQKMEDAEGRMKARDPSAARDDARAAADALQKAKDKARSAARQQQSDGGAGLDEEPIKIPGADEYKAPAHFREDILEAMKKKAPEGYDELVKQYYQELIR